ncbi:MAG: hypothetical protein RLZZ490_1553, partial [Cyanobacteriota bacterium]
MVGEIIVTEIEIIDNTVISTETLGALTVLDSEIPIKQITNQALSFAELLQIANRVAEYYAEQGYRTSGAVVVIPEITQKDGQGLIQIKVIEGRLGQVKVSIQNDDVLDTRFDHYVGDRLRVREGEVLNVDWLLESLQLLQLDPQIQTLNATLAAAPEANTSDLVV